MHRNKQVLGKPQRMLWHAEVYKNRCCYIPSLKEPRVAIKKEYVEGHVEMYFWVLRHIQGLKNPPKTAN